MFSVTWIIVNYNTDVETTLVVIIPHTESDHHLRHLQWFWSQGSSFSIFPVYKSFYMAHPIPVLVLQQPVQFSSVCTNTEKQVFTFFLQF